MGSAWLLVLGTVRFLMLGIGRKKGRPISVGRAGTGQRYLRALLAGHRAGMDMERAGGKSAARCFQMSAS
jgi:hypothetical protein